MKQSRNVVGSKVKIAIPDKSKLILSYTATSITLNLVGGGGGGDFLEIWTFCTVILVEVVV